MVSPTPQNQQSNLYCRPTPPNRMVGDLCGPSCFITRLCLSCIFSQGLWVSEDRRGSSGPYPTFRNRVRRPDTGEGGARGPAGLPWRNGTPSCPRTSPPTAVPARIGTSTRSRSQTPSSGRGTTPPASTPALSGAPTGPGPAACRGGPPATPAAAARRAPRGRRRVRTSSPAAATAGRGRRPRAGGPMPPPRARGRGATVGPGPGARRTCGGPVASAIGAS